MKLNLPAKDSLSNWISKETVLPSPNQLFSLILNAKLPPLVPIPAPALISPVGCSSTLIFIILRFFLLPSKTS